MGNVKIALLMKEPKMMESNVVQIHALTHNFCFLMEHVLIANPIPDNIRKLSACQRFVINDKFYWEMEGVKIVMITTELTILGSNVFQKFVQIEKSYWKMELVSFVVHTLEHKKKVNLVDMINAQIYKR